MSAKLKTGRPKIWSIKSKMCLSESKKIKLLKKNKKDFRKIELAEPLVVKEVIQAGDVFLVRFRCEVCRTISASGIDQLICFTCRTEWPNRGVVDPGRSKFRCLAGTKRKSGTISKKIVRLLMEMQQGDCAYWFVKLEKYHIEHIIPISFGGTNNQNNLVLACPRCNLTAGSAVFPSIEAKRNYILKRRYGFVEGL